MKHNVSTIFIIACSLVLLPGCGRIVDWAKDSFYQGENLQETNVPKKYLKTVIIHDQLMTAAIFDALWLSNPVKAAYTNTYVLKYGKSEERRKAFLRRQLEENRHFITFYVLSPFKYPLGDPESVWAVFLRVRDQDITPIEVKAVDLDPIYKAFFGKRFNLFKEVYRVKFEARDEQDRLVLDESVKRMDLVFRSVKKEAILSWYVWPHDISGVTTECDHDMDSDDDSQECGS